MSNNNFAPLFLQIASRLQEERERTGLKIEEFAEAGQTNKEQQLAFESGETSPDAHYLSVIHLTTGVDVNYILTGKRIETKNT